jgi:hypothetical protein
MSLGVARRPAWKPEMTISLRLGSLGGHNVSVYRSGAHWLCADGHDCRANEVVAFFNIAVRANGRAGVGAFVEERTLQVAVAPGIPGRLRIKERGAGGMLDVVGVHPWRQDDVIGEFEPDRSNGDADQHPGTAGAVLRLLLLAGRRMGWGVDADTTLLPGWHSRARAWWGDSVSGMRSLLGLGICDVSGILRGSRSGFVELFNMTPFPAHVAQVSEHPLVPCALTLIDQIERKPAELEAIRADVIRGLAEASPASTPEDWLFAGAFLRQLTASPICESDFCLTAEGLEEVGRPAAVLLSLASEPQTLHRHKRLGYYVFMLSHDVRAAGPAVRAWLKRAFEPVRRSTADIQHDYERLFSAARAASGARFMILNRMSSSGLETIFDYSSFAAPLGTSLAYVAAKELNVMLDDLGASQDVTIIDLDACAAEYGGAEHVPDGIHLSARLEEALRSEIVAALPG